MLRFQRGKRPVRVILTAAGVLANHTRSVTPSTGQAGVPPLNWSGHHGRAGARESRDMCLPRLPECAAVAVC